MPNTALLIIIHKVNKVNMCLVSCLRNLAIYMKSVGLYIYSLKPVGQSKLGSISSSTYSETHYSTPIVPIDVICLLKNRDI